MYSRTASVVQPPRPTLTWLTGHVVESEYKNPKRVLHAVLAVLAFALVIGVLAWTYTFQQKRLLGEVVAEPKHEDMCLAFDPTRSLDAAGIAPELAAEALEVLPCRADVPGAARNLTADELAECERVQGHQSFQRGKNLLDDVDSGVVVAWENVTIPGLVGAHTVAYVLPPGEAPRRVRVDLTLASGGPPVLRDSITRLYELGPRSVPRLAYADGHNLFSSLGGLAYSLLAGSAALLPLDPSAGNGSAAAYERNFRQLRAEYFPALPAAGGPFLLDLDGTSGASAGPLAANRTAPSRVCRYTKGSAPRPAQGGGRGGADLGVAAAGQAVVLRASPASKAALWVALARDLGTALCQRVVRPTFLEGFAVGLTVFLAGLALMPLVLRYVLNHLERVEEQPDPFPVEQFLDGARGRVEQLFNEHATPDRIAGARGAAANAEAMLRQRLLDPANDAVASYGGPAADKAAAATSAASSAASSAAAAVSSAAADIDIAEDRV